MEAGEKLKESSELPADRKNLDKKLGDVTKRWNELNTKSDDCSDVLDKAVVLTSQYQDLRAHFLPWLDGAEKKADEISPSCDPEVLKACKENLEVGFVKETLSINALRAYVYVGGHFRMIQK